MRSSTTYVGSSGTYRRRGLSRGRDWKTSTARLSRSIGVEAPERHAAEITKAALEGDSPIASAALELFCAMLGSIAGNAALMFGARGGVYIAGGIAPRITDFMARSEFRARFESKGRFATYLASVPTSVIVHPAATFVGLSSVVKESRMG